MKLHFPVGLAGLALAGLLAACSSAGDDVYVETSADRTGSSLSCDIAPGEDVCGRTFEMLDPSSRASFKGTASIAAEYAGIARQGRDQVANACGSILDQLGVARPLGVEPTEVAHATATCDAAVAAIATLDRAAFTISSHPGACSDVPASSCAPSTASPRRRCATPTVAWTVRDGASPRDELVAATLAKNLALAIEIKGRLEALASFTSDIAGTTGSLADARGHGANACVQTVISLVRMASEDTTTMANLSSALVSAIAPSM